jgi:flagellar hook-associated protein 3 FlgL
MATRITDSMISRGVLSDLMRADYALSQTQRKLSSGKEITRPSDDPFGTSRALSLRSELEGTLQFRRNADEAQSWSTATEVALSRMTDTVQRARELLVKAGNDTAGAPSREAIAVEIEALIESLKQEANVSHSGRYLFAGTDTLTQPYAVGGADAYAGNGANVAREIGAGVSVAVNVVGSDVLGDGQVAADDKLLHVLRDVVDHLRGGTPADANALRGTDLARLDANLDNLTGIRAIVGATANRVEAAAGRIDEIEESTRDLLSNTENVDMARALVDYSLQQSAYQSALRAGANIVQASLLDFLR